MQKLYTLLGKCMPLFILPLLLFGLYLSSLYSYLLFHSLMEIFSIVVGCCIFVLTWNSRERLDNNYLLFLGIAYLFVSALDLVHTLAYKGMGVFPGYDANLPTQLWIAARYGQSLSLLGAPLFLGRKLNPWVALLSWAAVAGLLLVVIFARIFPACYVEGAGLTPFKKISEYMISLVLLVSIVLLLKNRTAFDRRVLGWLVASLLLTIGAELAFTFYIGVYDFSNLIGHVFKMVAFYLVYVAIVETGLEKPQRLLFRNLKQNEAALGAALAEVQRLAITDSLTGLSTRRHFADRAENEFQRARRYRHPLSAIMVDIDHFKRVNDTSGHAVGDRVLQQVAGHCRQELRETDVVGRYGGDEFAILLPESDPVAAAQVAERLRQRIARQPLQTTTGPVAVTISLGIAALDDENLTLDILLSRADQALYDAKQGGRNRVCRR
jgi:diguanylate cyclase (GGDEF)-like protein